MIKDKRSNQVPYEIDMDGDKAVSGVMHCWLMAKIEVGGETFVALRGVNWRGEYDASRPHAPANTPWWHVPSSKFAFNPSDPVPSIEETKGKVMPIIHEEWPVLEKGTIVAVEQETTGAWGGFSQDGKRETVTRIAFDLGKASHLPEIILEPGENLPWPRHPVAWINADSITKLPNGRLESQGAHTSPYVVSGSHAIPMETNEGLQEKVATDLVLQQTVGDMFVKAFGEIFSPAPHRNHPRPTLTGKDWHP